MAFLKTGAERRVEAATWGLLLIWIGVMMSVDERAGLAALGAGSIMLASALIQKAMGWDAGLILWAGGIGLTLSGLNDLAGGDRNIPLLAAVLVIFGVLILLRAVSGKGSKYTQGLRVVRHRETPPDDRF